MKILAITGKMHQGKSLLTAIIKAKLQQKGDKLPIVHKFAGKLYQLQDLIYQNLNLPLPIPKDRKLLQLLGTEWGRHTIDNDIWVHQWEHDTKVLYGKYKNEKEPIFLVDDCRFNNEAQKIRDLKGIIVEIYGRKTDTNGIKNHESEIGICESYIDYYVRNNNDKDRLIFNADKLIELMGYKGWL